MPTPHTNTQRLRTLSIGGATYDLFLTLKDMEITDDVIRLAIGGKVPVERVIETCGGGACNTSVGLSRLEMDASFCGIVGSDPWGKKLLSTLATEGVDTTPATIVDDETSSFSIVLRLPSGERTILHHAGVNAHLHDATFDVHTLRTVDAVYLNHLCAASCMIYDDIIEVLSASKTSPILAWNPGGHQIEAGIHDEENKALLAHTRLLLLNKEEALAFTKEATIKGALTILTSAGASQVCITDGKNGCTASDGRALYHCPAVRDGTIVDTTGAGDAFGCGALFGLLHGESLPKMMIYGTLNASNVLGAVGSQSGLLTATTLTDALKQTRLEVTTLA